MHFLDYFQLKYVYNIIFTVNFNFEFVITLISNAHRKNVITKFNKIKY